jgi:hypothetical protein
MYTLFSTRDGDILVWDLLYCVCDVGYGYVFLFILFSFVDVDGGINYLFWFFLILGNLGIGTIGTACFVVVFPFLFA